MKRILFSLLFSIFAVTSHAQENEVIVKKPSYIQGKEALTNRIIGELWINPLKSLHMLKVEFLVDESGVVKEAKALGETKDFKTSPEEFLINETRWIPGSVNGKSQAMTDTLTIVYGIVQPDPTNKHTPSSKRNVLNLEDYKKMELARFEDNQTYIVSLDRRCKFGNKKVTLQKYLQHHLRYPKEALKNDVQGKVLVYFLVGEDGKVSDITVAKSLDPSCDEEAMRVVKKMPRWQPAYKFGKPIPTYTSLEISFHFDKADWAGLMY